MIGVNPSASQRDLSLREFLFPVARFPKVRPCNDETCPLRNNTVFASALPCRCVSTHVDRNGEDGLELLSRVLLK